MKRHPALQTFSREHQHTLSLAQQIIRAVKTEDQPLLFDLKGKVYRFYKDELIPHFEHEEASFFKIIADNYPQYHQLIEPYLAEHKTLLAMAKRIGELSEDDHLSDELEAFAILLKSHTRKEERELFPMIEDCFSDSEFKLLREL